jgi:hypothetical protein
LNLPLDVGSVGGETIGSVEIFGDIIYMCDFLRPEILAEAMVIPTIFAEMSAGKGEE